jgi:hypothetical protein
MLRRIALLTVVLALFALTFSGAGAQDAPDVSYFANIFPSDVNVYAAIRTDAGYIETLDGLLGRIQAALPAELGISDMSFSMFWQGLVGINGIDFQTEIRPWLGETFAIGVRFDADASPGLMIGVQIADRAAAQTFIETRLFADGAFTTTPSGAYTMYQSTPLTSDTTAFYLSDNALLFSFNMFYRSADTLAPLSDNSIFSAAVAGLPEADNGMLGYNALLYLDIPTLQPMLSMGMTEVMLLGGGNLLYPLAAGFTLMDGSTLIMDVSLVGDIPFDSSIDPAFTARIPADASLVIEGTSLSDVIDGFIEATRGQMIRLGLSESEINAQIDPITAQLSAVTGLDYESELLPALDGHFALFVRYEPVEPGAPQLIAAALYPGEAVPLNLGAALIYEVDDAAIGARLAASIQTALGMSGAQTENISLGGTEVVLTRVPVTPDSPTMLDLVYGVQGNLGAFGTRAEVEAVFAGAAGLDTAAGYQEALEYALPDPITFWYMDADGFNGILDLVYGLLTPAVGEVFETIIIEMESGVQITPTPRPTPDPMIRIRAQREQLAAIQAMTQAGSRIVSSSSISTTRTDGGMNIRLALTLSE